MISVRYEALYADVSALDAEGLGIDEIAGRLHVATFSVQAVLTEQSRRLRDAALVGVAERRRQAEERRAIAEEARTKLALIEIAAEEKRAAEKAVRELEAYERDQARIKLAAETQCIPGKTGRKAPCESFVARMNALANDRYASPELRQARACGLHLIDLKLAGHSPRETELQIDPDGGLPFRSPIRPSLQTAIGSPAAMCCEG